MFFNADLTYDLMLSQPPYPHFQSFGAGMPADPDFFSGGGWVPSDHFCFPGAEGGGGGSRPVFSVILQCEFNKRNSPGSL